MASQGASSSGCGGPALQDAKRTFPFPFSPYEVQKQLMGTIFGTLRQSRAPPQEDRDGKHCGQVLLIESPTGTGKSLSLIVSTLEWLLEEYPAQRKQELAEELQAGADQADDEPDWVNEFFLEQEEKKFQHRQEVHSKRASRVRQQELKRKRSSMASLTSLDAIPVSVHEKKSPIGTIASRTPSPVSTPVAWADDDADLVAAVDWDDDGDLARQQRKWERHVQQLRSGTPSSTLEENSDEELPDAAEQVEEEVQILYCSRTHSQLSQWVNEIKHTAFHDRVRCISLGSRKNLCVNSAVAKAGSTALINDKCLDLVQGKKKKKKKDKQSAHEEAGGCPYLENSSQRIYADHALSSVRDIEELHTLGQRLKACPYYGNRRAMHQAHIVTLPYAALVHKPTRESLGLSLRNKIVVIDEAHNLMEAINQVYSARVTLDEVAASHRQLARYFERYSRRLKGVNALHIKQLLKLLSALHSFIAGVPPQSTKPSSSSGGRSSHSGRIPNKSRPRTIPSSVPRSSPPQTGTPSAESTYITSVNRFLFSSHVDNFNLFRLIRYIDDAKLCQKLHGFVDKYYPVDASGDSSAPDSGAAHVVLHRKRKNAKQRAQGQPQGQPQGHPPPPMSAHISALGRVKEFMVAITNSDIDGRVLVSTGRNSSGHEPGRTAPSLQFILLNPAVNFREVVQQSRAVILAGGTMQPFHLFKQQLFTDVPSDKVRSFACGHVVEPDNVLVLPLTTGPTNTRFDFTFKSRENRELLQELGRVVLNLCSVVPAGIVCFFSSYKYEAIVCERWKRSGVLAKISKKKKLFREPRDGAVESTLQAYAAFIEESTGGQWTGTQTGALLTCVVGGKMSEGINFSDDLARCVIMVGLPYANLHDPELKEKMAYLDTKYASPASAPASTAAASSHSPRGVHASGPSRCSPGAQYYEHLCMRAVNQSIGRAIRHRADYATIVLVDHRYGRPGIISQLPGWLQERIPRQGSGNSSTSTPTAAGLSFGGAFAALSRFFRRKRQLNTPSKPAAGQAPTAARRVGVEDEQNERKQQTANDDNDEDEAVEQASRMLWRGKWRFSTW